MHGVAINLIVGMTAKDGIAELDHLGFRNLVERPILDRFGCAYVPENESPVHTKAYAWFDGKTPICGYVGSANYTRTGFFRNQREVMEESDPRHILRYYEEIARRAVSCMHPEVQGLVRSDEERGVPRSNSDNAVSRLAGLQSVHYTLLDNSGNLPRRSGLNWGQRPEEGRDPNQAYIRVPSDVARSDFFPPRGTHFMLHTDDGQVIVCGIKQDAGKAIHSTENNSILGEYFRRRLNVHLGAMIERHHLEQYGRTDITFYRIDDENYFMDFSVSP